MAATTTATTPTRLTHRRRCRRIHRPSSSSLSRRPADLARAIWFSAGLNVSVFIGVGATTAYLWGADLQDPITITWAPAWPSDDPSSRALAAMLCAANAISYCLDSIPLARACQVSSGDANGGGRALGAAGAGREGGWAHGRGGGGSCSGQLGVGCKPPQHTIPRHYFPSSLEVRSFQPSLGSSRPTDASRRVLALCFSRVFASLLRHCHAAARVVPGLRPGLVDCGVGC